MYNSLVPSMFACYNCCSWAMASSTPCLNISSSYCFYVYFWCLAICRSKIYLSRSLFCEFNFRYFISLASSGAGALGPKKLAVFLSYLLRSFSSYCFFSSTWSSRDFIWNFLRFVTASFSFYSFAFSFSTTNSMLSSSCLRRDFLSARSCSYLFRAISIAFWTALGSTYLVNWTGLCLLLNISLLLMLTMSKVCSFYFSSAIFFVSLSAFSRTCSFCYFIPNFSYHSFALALYKSAPS